MRPRVQKRLLLTALLTAPLLMLAGCGQTGSLYFDENPPADQLPPSKKSTLVNAVPPATDEQPADEKKDAPR